MSRAYKELRDWHRNWLGGDIELVAEAIGVGGDGGVIEEAEDGGTGLFFGIEGFGGDGAGDLGGDGGGGEFGLDEAGLSGADHSSGIGDWGPGTIDGGEFLLLARG